MVHISPNYLGNSNFLLTIIDQLTTLFHEIRNAGKKWYLVQHCSAHPSESVAGIQLLLRVQAVSKSRRRRPRAAMYAALLVSSADTGYAGAAGEGQALS